MGETHSSRDGVIKDLSQLDPSLLKSKSDEKDLAEDGPNAGDAGEEEAVMARATQSRKQVRDLVTELTVADPALGPTEALRLLETLNDEGQEVPKKLKLGQFASDELVEKTEAYIASHSTEEPVESSRDDLGLVNVRPLDQGEPDSLSGEANKGDEATPSLFDQDAPDGLEPWKQQLLDRLILARQARGSDAQLCEADELGLLLYALAFEIYRERGVADEIISGRLVQRTDGTAVTEEDVEADQEAYRKTWYFRTAFWMISSAADPLELLRGFELPVLRRPKPQRSSAEGTRVEPPAADDNGDTSSEDSDSQSDSVGDVKRQIVDSRDLPKPSRKSARGLLKDLTDSLRAIEGDADVDEPSSGEVAAAGASSQGNPVGSRDRRRSDESILANLPDDVIIAAIAAVIEDDDLEEAWAYRSPETIRAEADRRLLVEYGQPVTV